LRFEIDKLFIEVFAEADGMKIALLTAHADF
jgi:hypothetical protein